MPKAGGAYKITDDWRRRVREGIDAMRDENGKPISDAKFARLARISKTSLHDALAPDSVQTAFMPQINKALGWPEPVLVIAPDTLEMLAQINALSDFKRGQYLERLRQDVERERAAKEQERPRRR